MVFLNAISSFTGWFIAFLGFEYVYGCLCANQPYRMTKAQILGAYAFALIIMRFLVTDGATFLADLLLATVAFVAYLSLSRRYDLVREFYRLYRCLTRTLIALTADIWKR